MNRLGGQVLFLRLGLRIPRLEKNVNVYAFSRGLSQKVQDKELEKKTVTEKSRRPSFKLQWPEFRRKENVKTSVQKLSLGASVINAIKYGGNPVERRDAIKRIMQDTVLNKGQAEEEMGLLEAVRGLTEVARKLNTKFGGQQFPLSLINTPGLHYYLEYTESIVTPTWKRRKHLFSSKAKPEFLRKVRRCALMSDYAYHSTMEEVKSSLIEMTKHIDTVKGDWEMVHFNSKALPGKPAHYLAIFHPDDGSAPEGYLVLRGTFSIPDIITDTEIDSVPFYEGVAHGGMYASGMYIAHTFAKTLKGLQNVKRSTILNKAMKMNLIGHSLGGGAAAVATIHLRRSRNINNIECFTVGCPPVISKELAEDCSGYVTSAICDDDIVSRLTAASVIDLTENISKFNWTHFLRRDIEEFILELQYMVPLLLSSPDSREKLLQVIQDHVLAMFEPSPLDKMRGLSSFKKRENDLFLPGSLLHMYRNGRGFSAAWVRRSMFMDIVFSRTMLDDHFCESYVRAANDVLDA